MKIRSVVLLAAVVAISAACSTQKMRVEVDTKRLLEDNEMQGWSFVEKAPPVVGEFDVIYIDRGASNRRTENENCSYASGPNGTFVACPEEAGTTQIESRPQGKRRLPSQKSDVRSI